MSSTKQSNRTDQILELLTSNPTGEEVARALALDYLLPFSATKIRITSVSSDDTLHFLGDYGWTPSTTHSEEKSEVWRKRRDSIRDVKINGDFFWNQSRSHNRRRAIKDPRGHNRCFGNALP